MSIQPFDRGGECFRCHTVESGKKVFLLMPNPSFNFGSIQPDTPPIGVMIEHCVVCENCLTPEEKVELVAPVMLSILNLFIPIHASMAHQTVTAAAHLHAYFAFRAGPDARWLHSTELVDKIIKLLPL